MLNKHFPYASITLVRFKGSTSVISAFAPLVAKYLTYYSLPNQQNANKANFSLN
ncbi:hypothetical protein lacNasYZ03_14030 [Lactobacillus nasalidis]|uniref:Uncharacterized protein n=1 Tax=Lactobacillus nasalidis TaxID=2797258 RepID=A0ABQ3W863_9LACO|nr:hypothetical protein lacNasYZ01_04350 [Lactobacillus nasalidis]GHV99456.1 hypothetical protein lacNasYZ02_08860 [Lactobacillus nasalidis]GHW01716.1 hypothetical protein lacNasYZ03_14030 [Lactobacillus nasalidis]